MRLVHPKVMTAEQDGAYRLCLATVALPLSLECLKTELSRQWSVIEEGVQVIDDGLPIPGAGRTDWVAVDRTQNLILIRVVERLTGTDLEEALLQSDWVTKHAEIFEHFYTDLKVKSPPRVWLFAGDVAPGTRQLASRLTDPVLSVFECHALCMQEERWIFVERLGAMSEAPLPEACAPVASILSDETPVTTPSIEPVPVNSVETPTGPVGVATAFKLSTLLTDEEVSEIMGEVKMAEYEDERVSSTLAVS